MTTTKKVLRVMDSSGDRPVEFDLADDASTAEARALFERVTRGGAAVFAVNRDGDAPDKRVRNFNELESENVVVPALIGG